MTVRQLKNALQLVDDDLPVVVDRDDEISAVALHEIKRLEKVVICKENADAEDFTEVSLPVTRLQCYVDALRLF